MVTPAAFVASVRSSRPSCQLEVCTVVAVAQPSVVLKSAGPDCPAAPAVVRRTVLPPRCVVIWNGEVATLIVYPGPPFASGTRSASVWPDRRKSGLLGAGAAAAPAVTAGARARTTGSSVATTKIGCLCIPRECNDRAGMGGDPLLASTAAAFQHRGAD